MSQAAELARDEPDFVIVDESCVSVFIAETRVDPKHFGDRETYRCPTALPEDNAEMDDHAETGRYVVEQISAGPGFLQRIRDQKCAGNMGSKSEARSGSEHDATDLAAFLKCLRAAAAAASREPSTERICPSDTDATVREKLRNLRPNAGRGVATVFRQLARDLANGTETSKAIEWVPAATHFGGRNSNRDGVSNDCVVWHGLKKLSFSEKVPLLLIDADANVNVNNRAFCRARWTAPLRAVEIQARRRGRFIQCRSSTFSKKGFRWDKARGMDTCLKILQLAKERVEAGRRVLIVFNKPIRKLFTGESADKLPLYYPIDDCIEVTHFGAFIGQNRWSKFDTIIIVGREEPPVEAIEDMAKAIYGDDPTVTLDLTGDYVRATRPYGPDSAFSANISVHPDPRVHELLHQRREQLSCQAVDRMRLIYADERVPEMIVLCDLPLPGIVPDRLASAKDIFGGGSRFERAIDRGFFSTNAGLLAGMYPDLWGSTKAAEHDLAQTRSETPEMHIDNILYARGGFLFGEFRVAGKGARRWSKFWFNPVLISDPENAIRKALLLPTDIVIDIRVTDDDSLTAVGTVFTGEVPAANPNKDRHGQGASAGAATQGQRQAPNLRLVSIRAEEGPVPCGPACLPSQHDRLAA
jgi:hypothetical protein